MITSSPALKVSRRIEHPGQFSVGTTLKNWSIFVRHQHPHIDFIKQIRSGALGASQFPATMQDATGQFTKPAGW
ncbi:MAG: hypothetical protein EBX17_08200 [Betaproteobacteria bacterium]|nr:hypothetical protein [Betaproteobacteria bacterium]